MPDQYPHDCYCCLRMSAFRDALVRMQERNSYGILWFEWKDLLKKLTGDDLSFSMHRIVTHPGIPDRVKVGEIVRLEFRASNCADGHEPNRTASVYCVFRPGYFSVDLDVALCTMTAPEFPIPSAVEAYLRQVASMRDVWERNAVLQGRVFTFGYDTKSTEYLTARHVYSIWIESLSPEEYRMLQAGRPELAPADPEEAADETFTEILEGNNFEEFLDQMRDWKIRDPDTWSFVLRRIGQLGFNDLLLEIALFQEAGDDASKAAALPGRRCLRIAEKEE